VASRALTEKEREKLTVFLHKGAAGDWNFDVLANEFELDDLLEWGFEKPELDLDLWAPEPPEDVEPQIDKAEELREKWGVKSGDLWKLGEHRLICGDCTDKAVVERVMGGEKAAITMTSPPYWVGKDYETQNSKQEIIDFISSVADGINVAMRRDNARIVINTGTGSRRAVEGDNAPAETWLLLSWWIDALGDNGWIMRHCRIWSKSGGLPAIISPQADVVDQHWEFIATFYDPKQKQRGQNRVSEKWPQQGVWEFQGKMTFDGHKAAFPLELPSRIIELYAINDESVYEPFLGSGTTLIACERLGRKCRAVEISPAYVAVAIQRWVDVTGKEPELL
jgi:hypothetical protein